MTELLPLALPCLLAVVLLLCGFILFRRFGRAVAGVERRLLYMEQNVEMLQKSVDEKSTRNNDKADIWEQQLKEEIKAALAMSRESVMKKVSETDSAQKRRLDQLETQLHELRGKVGSAVSQAAASSTLETPAQPAQPQKATVNDIHSKARRFARLIVTDIALYNRKLVEEGVQNGNFNELLEHDIREAQALYARRVPEEIRNTTSYLDEAFAELQAKIKGELNL